MKVLTTAPGLQLYTGNFIENVRGKEGVTYQKHAGLCLETQVCLPPSHAFKLDLLVLLEKQSLGQILDLKISKNAWQWLGDKM